MNYDLTKTNPTLALTVGRTQDGIERYTNEREVQDIYKQGAKHVEAERIQAAKQAVAISLTTAVQEHALREADRYARSTFALLEAPGRSAGCQAYIEEVAQDLTTVYRQQLSAEVQVGGLNIAAEAARPVIVPQPEKKGWWR